MALTITGVEDCRAVLGPSQDLRAYQLAPGVSDYPTGGYIITAQNVGMSLLYGAFIIARNAAAEIFEAQFILAGAAFGTRPQPQSSIALRVLEVATSSGSYYEFAEVANGYNLTGFEYIAYFIGY